MALALPAACPLAAHDESPVIDIPATTELSAAIARAKQGHFPRLCAAHYRGRCPRGAACPRMHGVADTRFVFDTVPGVMMPGVGTVYTWSDGTQSVIAADEVNAAEITPAKVADYAEWMEMDMARDGALAWIAREALAAPVLAPWRLCRTDGDVYYFNFATNASAWDHPMDASIGALYAEEKEAVAVRRAEARRFVMAYRRCIDAEGFGCLLAEVVSWVVREPEAVAQ